MKKFGVFLYPVVVAMLLLACVVPARADSVLISTPDITVTDDDVMKYLLFLAESTGRQLEDLSGQRVSQAVIELYALKTLDADSRQIVDLGDEQWLKEYLFSMERAARYLRMRTDEAMRATDWSAEARSYYLGNKDQFVEPESVTIRTLLIRLGENTTDEAIEIVKGFNAGGMDQEQFEALVREYTDDRVARADGGLMRKVRRGQTVPQFEDAAFALEVPGDVSPPTVSQFGVHLIQLIEKHPSRTLTFAEVERQIISELEIVRREEYLQAFREEARSREPEGYIIDTDAIDTFMNSLGFAKKEPPSAP